MNVKSYLCRSLTAFNETRALNLCRNFTFYFIQLGKKGVAIITMLHMNLWYFTNLSTMQRHFLWAANRLSMVMSSPFKSLLNCWRHSQHPVSYHPPTPLPLPLFLVKANLRLSLVKGQCFQGKHIGLYIHLIKNIWNVYKSNQIQKKKRTAA